MGRGQGSGRSNKGGGGGGSDAGQSASGGGAQEIKAQTPTIQIQTEDSVYRKVASDVPLNPVTAELAKGGQLQNTKLNVSDPDLYPKGFEFGKEITAKGFAVDRRQWNINDVNRELRRQEIKVKIHKSPAVGRSKFFDAENNQYYVEFIG